MDCVILPRLATGHITPRLATGHVIPRLATGHVIQRLTVGHVIPRLTTGHVTLKLACGHVTSQDTLPCQCVRCDPGLHDYQAVTLCDLLSVIPWRLPFIFAGCKLEEIVV